MKKNDLVVFGEDWGKLPSSTQHLMSHLAEDRKILWVNSIGLRTPRCSAHDIKRVFSKIWRWQKSKSDPGAAVKTHENITVLNPISIPAPSNTLTRKLSALVLKRQILPTIERLSLYKPLLWASLPTAGDVADLLPVEGLVYYCGDDFSALAGVDHDVIHQHEKRLVEKCDLVIAASEALVDKFPQEKTHLLTHGVDYDLFSKSTSPARDLPSRRRPTAGFYGSISDWLDCDLMLQVIKALPNWNFVFVGKESRDISAIKALPNTYFLGPKAHDELPRYSQHWDVSLLPFVLNRQIASCNPLKLMEYLSTGKPIVSTRFPAAEKYRGLVQCVDSAEAFVTALKMSLYAQQVPSFTESIRQNIQLQTWGAKASSVSAWLTCYE